MKRARVELSDVHAIVLCPFRGDAEMKKILLTVLLLLLFCLPREVSAAEGTYTEGYFQYEIVDEGIVITGYFGSEKTVAVPADIAGYPVSEIGAEAFLGSTVTELILPETIMKIGENALPSNCHVTYVGIPETDAGEEAADLGTENGTAGEAAASGTENGTAGETDAPGAENGTADNADAGIAENGETSGSGAAPVSDNHSSSGSGSIDEAEVVLEEPVSESKGQSATSGKGSGKDGSSGGTSGKDSASGGTIGKDGSSGGTAGTDSTSAAKNGSREAAGSEQAGGHGILYLFAGAIVGGIAFVIVRRKKKGQ